MRKELPPQWRFLEADPDCRRLPKNIEEVVNELRIEYGRDLLLKAKLLVQRRTGDHVNPRLTTDDGIILPVAQSRQAPI
jgi:hypothetical protein